MSKFVLTYLGGGVATTPEDREVAMAKWGQWFGELGSALVDMGNPFAASTAVAADGSRGPAGTALTGYTIVSADSLEAAAILTKGCPIFDGGGSVEIYEAHEV